MLLVAYIFPISVGEIKKIHHCICNNLKVSSMFFHFRRNLGVRTNLLLAISIVFSKMVLFLTKVDRYNITFL